MTLEEIVSKERDNRIIVLTELNDSNWSGRDSMIGYWCNSCGELHFHGKFDISEDELPPPLLRAYNELWEDDCGGCNTYLVDTMFGFGISMCAEYSTEMIGAEGMSEDELFKCLLDDAELLAECPELSNAKFFAMYGVGPWNEHELSIVLPADTPKDEFDKAKKAVLQKTYRSLERRDSE